MNLDDAPLFDMEVPPPVSLADRFGVAPFSYLDRRQGEWQDRKRRWLSMGIQSELGRTDRLLSNASSDGWGKGFVSEQIIAQGVTSVFDPVVCELAYRWFSSPGDKVLDPFAGGSVRGVVASTLARHYTGVELRAEQVQANRQQAHLGSDIEPRWVEGDSTDLAAALDPVDDDFDLIFSCPPYADLEVYSDDPRDLSTMPYADFLDAYGTAVAEAAGRLREDRFAVWVVSEAAARLREDRFAVWVVSDIRDKDGNYRGLVGDTVTAFQRAGMNLYNDAVVLDPVGTVRLRAGNLFNRTRKLSRLHQHFLVFVKGDGKRAAKRLPDIDAGRNGQENAA